MWTLSERNSGGWQGIYHPEASRCAPNRTGPFIKAYAIEGFVEFAFKFSNATLEDVNRRTPGKSRTRHINYEAPFDNATPHFVTLRSFSGKFVTSEGKLTDRPLGAFDVNVWIKEPGTLACTVRLTDNNSDDPVEVEVAGVIVFFH